jgi:hypothetical protein
VIRAFRTNALNKRKSAIFSMENLTGRSGLQDLVVGME